jgi:hypothetical protein
MKDSALSRTQEGKESIAERHFREIGGELAISRMTTFF